MSKCNIPKPLSKSSKGSQLSNISQFWALSGIVVSETHGSPLRSKCLPRPRLVGKHLWFCSTSSYLGSLTDLNTINQGDIKVTVHEIKEKEVPELDDELAKDVSEFDTLEELKADIKSKLEAQKAEEAKMELENKLLEKISENSKIDIPEAMIENQISSSVNDFSYRLR